MDEKLLGALNNLSDALSEIADLMSQKSSEKDSDASKALIGGDLTEQINGINEGIKSIKSDTTKILSNQATIMGMAKEKGDKDDIAAQVGGDKDKQSMIKDGLSTILLIGVAVVALGAAFNLIGDVDFGSVIALSIAIPILALSFMKVNEKMKESKFDPKKDGINLLLTMLGISLAVVASSYILGLVQPVGLAQLGTTILIAGMFAAIGFSLSNILEGFKDVSIGDALKSSILMPLLFPAIALAIVGSSYLLGQVQPVGLAQLLTAFAISVLFVPLGFAAGMMLKSFKDISPGAAIATMVAVPIVMVGLSYAILESSKLLSGVETIGLGQFITSLAISILFIPLAFAAGTLIKMTKGIGLKEMVTLPITMVLMSGAVMLSSHILSESAEIDPSKLFNLLLTGVTLAAISIALGGAMVLMNKMGKTTDYLMGGLATLIVAGTIMISSHILALGNYDEYPSTDWAAGVGLSMLSFGLSTLAFGLAILATGGIGLVAIAAGGLATLIVAGSIMASSHILAAGDYGSYPPIEWAAGTGLSMLAFGIPILALGTAILLSGGLGLLAIYAGVEAVETVAEAIVGVSNILSNGNYGNGPSLEWATSTALLLAAFAPAVVLLGTLSAIPFVGGAILESGSEAVLGIARTIVGTADILSSGNFTGGPTKEWAEGIGIAIGAFAPIYEMLLVSGAMTALFGGGVSPDDFAKAINTVSGGIVDAAKYFSKNSASFEDGPTKEWAEGVGGAIGAFAPVYGMLLENSGWMSSGVSVDDFKAAINTVADGIIEVSGKFKGTTFEGGPSKEWAAGVGGAISAFAPVYNAIKDDVDNLEYMNEGILDMTDSIIEVGKRFSKNPDIWGSYPNEDWVNGVRTSIEGFANIVSGENKIDLNAFEGGLIDSPIENIADGMHSMADAYDRLGDSIVKFNTSLDGMNLDKVNAFRMLTNNIAVLSAMDSDMFSDMMEVLEENSSVFTDLLKQQTSQDNSKVNVGGTLSSVGGGTSPLEEQNRILSEKIDAMIGLLSNINNSNSSIDDHLTSQIDKNKELM